VIFYVQPILGYKPTLQILYNCYLPESFNTTTETTRSKLQGCLREEGIVIPLSTVAICTSLEVRDLFAVQVDTKSRSLGLWLNDPSSITNSRFYNMCEMFIQFPRPNQRWQLYSLGEDNAAQDAIPRNSEEIHQGRYVILSPSRETIPVQVINDQAINQTGATRPGASRANQPNFRRALENRDNHVCPITGFVGGDGRPGNAGLSAAHIVPSGRHDVWLRDNMANLITDQTPAQQIGPDAMYSAQNGLHLANYVHGRFDNFAISVDVDVMWPAPAFALVKLLTCRRMAIGSLCSIRTLVA
jgi:hypothetical protein